jgi:hypothetical protein
MKRAAREQAMERMIRRMVGTFEDLSLTQFARIDAAHWARRYRHVAKRLGIKIKTGE